LETLGIEVVRTPVEQTPMDVFTNLQPNDILFIDSTHMVRPQGDVLFEILELLPQIKPGVFVHVHDIYTPHDYPHEWVINDRKLWNEQYLLEAYLSENPNWEILAAGNWLARHHRERLSAACPRLLRHPAVSSGSFWMRRK
jgi:hypothetical protein